MSARSAEDRDGADRIDAVVRQQEVIMTRRTADLAARAGLFAGAASPARSVGLQRDNRREPEPNPE